MISLSRRSLLKAAARLGVGAGLALLGLGGERSQAQEESEGPYFRESATTLTLGNRFYEVDFDSRNGAITRIFDKRGGGVVSEGSADGSLWVATPYEEPTWIGAHQVSRADFQWDWDAVQRHLTFVYRMDRADYELQTTIRIFADNDPWFDLAARLDYIRGPEIQHLHFPNLISFHAQEVRDAFFPYLPGVTLSQHFFQEGRNYTERYPSGSCFADLSWIGFNHGSLAIYPLFGESEFWQTQIGYWHVDWVDPPRSAWVHQIAAALRPGEVLETPRVRIAVGMSILDAANAYRRQNQIDRYSSIDEKLGDIAEPFRRSLFMSVRHTTVEHSLAPFNSEERQRLLFDKLRPPAILHPHAYMPQGWVRSDPDNWPPADSLGGAKGFLDAFGQAQRDGHLVAPFRNPTLWHENTETAAWLAASGASLPEVSVLNRNGDLDDERSFAFFDWDTGEFHTPEQYQRYAGYIVSPTHRRVQERWAAFEKQHEEARSDLWWDDQIGARRWRFDYNQATERPTLYSHGWLEYMRRFADHRIMIEGGDDRLAETAIGAFWGTMSWARYFGQDWWGDGNWSEWPLACAMLRKEMLLFMHNVNDNSMLNRIENLRYCLSMGYLPAYDEWSLDLPWVNVAFDFAHHVSGAFADELLESFKGDTSSVTVSSFETFEVTADWTGQGLQLEKHTLSPGGVIAAAYDNSVVAGVFHRYNGHDLTPGDHYLIEQRTAQGIVVRQPMGADTALAIRALPSHADRTLAAVTAFNLSDELVSRSGIHTRGGDVEFLYSAVDGERDAFGVSIVFGRRNIGDGLEVVDRWGGSVVVERQGREARGFTSDKDWKPLDFRFSQEAFVSGRDPLVEVEYFDEVQVIDGGGPSLNVSYASKDNPDKHLYHWDGDHAGNRAWKTHTFRLNDARFGDERGDVEHIDFTMWVAPGYYIGKVTVTNADELERRTVAYYTIHDPTQGETLTQGLHLRGWTDATQPITDLDLDGLGAIFAWDAEDERWQMYSPHVPASANTLDRLEQGRAYYVRVANGQTLHWPEAPYGGVGFLLQPGRNLVCWLGTPDKPLTDAIAPLRGMKAEPLVSVQIDDTTYDAEESRQATEPLAYGQALWVEIDAVGLTRWLQF